MSSLLIAIISYVGYIIAYKTYGKYISKRIFKLSNDNITPAYKYNDGIDYVPTKKEILFGHHFTSIAGTGPIVGPALAIIWGWLPAVLWIFFGAIFIGAIHDFSALVVSARKGGKSIAEITEDIISPTSRTLFFLIVFFALLIVIAIFAMIIGFLFDHYPGSVFPIWFEVVIAVSLSYIIYKKGGNVTLWSLLAVVIMYVTIYIGTLIPIKMPALIGSPLITWIVIILLYSYFASTLPVQTLLQPRDYINSHELFVAGGLILLGVVIANKPMAAPMLNPHPPGAPSILPFLFIIIACGAISGFHGLVSSGTTVKQLNKETDSLFIGYGGMLFEGALAVLVIICAGAGLGGREHWLQIYHSWQAAGGLSAKISAFVEGGAFFIEKLGIGINLAKTILAVFIVSFAATTIDSATRIQRYIIEELSEDFKFKYGKNRYISTFIAIGSALALAMIRPDGKGALILWPLFGAVNQLLAAITLLVVTVYLFRKKTKFVFTLLPMLFMIVMTFWAMILNINNFIHKNNWLLFIIGIIILLLELWLIIEAINIVVKTKKEPLVEPVQ